MYIDIQIVEPWPICETSLAVAVAGPRMCITLESLRESRERTQNTIIMQNKDISPHLLDTRPDCCCPPCCGGGARGGGWTPRGGWGPRAGAGRRSCPHSRNWAQALDAAHSAAAEPPAGGDHPGEASPEVLDLHTVLTKYFRKLGRQK